MSVRTQHTNSANWFVTFTCYEWQPLFEVTNGYDLVYKWFNYLQESNKAEVIAYVIMPNHFHAVLHLPDSTVSLNKLVGNGKRFMAYGIIERLTGAGNQKLLKELSKGVSVTDQRKGQKHRVFETSFDAKVVNSDKFLLQKMSYIHLNPVSKKWSLVADYTAYEHSSASFYELGTAKHFTPKHYKAIGCDEERKA